MVSRNKTCNYPVFYIWAQHDLFIESGWEVMLMLDSITQVLYFQITLSISE